MYEKVRQNVCNYTFLFLFAIICPVSVLAPIGTWLPLVISAIILMLFSKSLFNNLERNNIALILLLFLVWVLFSVVFINKTFQTLEKFFQLLTIIFTGFLIAEVAKKNIKYNQLIFTLSLSFILSSLIIIVDYNYEIGLKLWLSQNLDSKNFDNYFFLKSWISLKNFKSNNYEIIDRYLNNTYDRGITSLAIISLPLAALCFFYKLRLLAFASVLLCILALFSLFNLTALLVYVFIIMILIVLLLSKTLYKNFFLVILGLYFLFAPFILGNLDYRNFAFYEKKMIEKKSELLKKYPYLDIPGSCKENNAYAYKQWNKHEICHESIAAVTLKGFLHSKKSLPRFLDTLTFYKLHIEDKLIHRRVIWSFVKEKILEKPIFGNGIFSSRALGESIKVVNIHNKKMSAIPLHTHNGILQVWLELGFIGVLLFYIFMLKLVNTIYAFSKINFYYSAICFISLIQIFSIGQLSYGFWQSWWIAIMAFNFILYSILFNNIINLRKLQSN